MGPYHNSPNMGTHFSLAAFVRPEVDKDKVLYHDLRQCALRILREEGVFPACAHFRFESLEFPVGF